MAAATMSLSSRLQRQRAQPKIQAVDFEAARQGGFSLVTDEMKDVEKVLAKLEGLMPKMAAAKRHLSAKPYSAQVREFLAAYRLVAAHPIAMAAARINAHPAPPSDTLT
jgi:hypothetical protein